MFLMFFFFFLVVLAFEGIARRTHVFHWSGALDANRSWVSHLQLCCGNVPLKAPKAVHFWSPDFKVGLETQQSHF